MSITVYYYIMYQCSFLMSNRCMAHVHLYNNMEHLLLFLCLMLSRHRVVHVYRCAEFLFVELLTM